MDNHLRITPKSQKIHHLWGYTSVYNFYHTDKQENNLIKIYNHLLDIKP